MTMLRDSTRSPFPTVVVETDPLFRFAPDHPAFRFATFAVCDRSKAVFSAAVAVAENPGRVHNPLLIYGATASGKSHLLHAIAIRMRRKQPHSQILRVSTQELTESMVTAIRYDTVPAFSQTLLALDALLLDDLQVLKDKKRTLEELILALRRLVDSGVQVVIAMSVHPKLLRLTKEQVAMQFPRALIAKLRYPDREARVQIVRRACASAGIPLSEESCRSLAERSVGSPRNLMSSVARIKAEEAISAKTSDRVAKL